MIPGIVASQINTPVFPWMRISTATVASSTLATPSVYYIMNDWMSIMGTWSSNPVNVSTPSTYTYVYDNPMLNAVNGTVATTFLPTPSVYYQGP